MNTFITTICSLLLILGLFSVWLIWKNAAHLTKQNFLESGISQILLFSHVILIAVGIAVGLVVHNKEQTDDFITVAQKKVAKRCGNQYVGTFKSMVEEGLDKQKAQKIVLESCK